MLIMTSIFEKRLENFEDIRLNQEVGIEKFQIPTLRRNRKKKILKKKYEILRKKKSSRFGSATNLIRILNILTSVQKIRRNSDAGFQMIPKN